MKKKETKTVFTDIVENDCDWIDEDLNPILPKEYLEKIDNVNIKNSYELKYDALVNKNLKISQEEFNKMVMHFKVEKQYDKVDEIYDAYAKQED